jgi:hypothetical protein
LTKLTNNFSVFNSFISLIRCTHPVIRCIQPKIRWTLYLQPMTPTPDEDFVFTGWGGHPDCVGSDSESTAKPLLGNRLCIAFFRQIRQLTVLKTGDGELTFYAPYETTCENDTCTSWYSHGMNVYLWALLKEPNGLVTWGGDCSGGDQWQQVRMMADKVCTVTFE